MIRRAFFVLCGIGIAVVGGYAQARHSVTNMDLERYRQQRVSAERELREDYTKLGFASPEEMARRNAESQQQMIDLSQRLKADRLERERVELEHARLVQAMQPVVTQVPYGYGYGGAVQPGDYFWPLYWGDGTVRNGRFRGRFQQDGYFAGGQFWPQGNRTPIRPAFVAPRATPHRR
jgi:hypothetical protein